MKIGIISTEIYPLAKAGGLADFTYSLAKYLNKNSVSAYFILPLYKAIEEKYLQKKNVKSHPEIGDEYTKKLEITDTGKEVDVTVGFRKYKFRIYKVQGEEIQGYLFDNKELFGRDFIYGPPGEAYADNDIRFGGFCWAVAQALKEGKIENFEILHSNDWLTALVPLITKKILGLPVKNVFTIHNMAYQGFYPKEELYKLNLPESLYNMEYLEFYGLINIMKAGIIFSDYVTTVSPTYAEEITTYEYGYGLEGLIKKYKWKIKGIINGIDYETLNPQRDNSIYFKFSSKSIQAREKNKVELCKSYNLDPQKALIGTVSRMTHQKGFHLIVATADRLSRLNANFLFVGIGEYQLQILKLAEKYSNIKVETRFTEAFSRKVFASLDFILVPSIFEPCGISQLIGMRYGAIPIVRETGGLSDTVRDISEKGGYGITFKNPTEEELLCAIKRSIELYENKTKFKKLRKEVMMLDFSAEKMANEYIKVYTEIYQKPF